MVVVLSALSYISFYIPVTRAICQTELEKVFVSFYFNFCVLVDIETNN